MKSPEQLTLPIPQGGYSDADQNALRRAIEHGYQLLRNDLVNVRDHKYKQASLAMRRHQFLLMGSGSGDGSASGSVIGKHTLFIPAGSMRPTASNGCAALTAVETTSGRPDMIVLDFDATADEHAQFQVAMPKMWNLGTVTFQVFWTTTATDTDGVAWGLQGVAVPDNSTIDVAYGTPVVVTDDAQSAAEEQLVTAESSAVTIAGTPGDDYMCYFRIFRDVSDANDDMTEDARLIGIKLFYTTDAATDA